MGDPQAWPVSAVSVAETRAQATAAELAEIARIAAKEPLRSAQLCGRQLTPDSIMAHSMATVAQC